MRETEGVVYSAQCGKFTAGCGVGAEPLPREADSAPECCTATRDSRCWIPCSVLLPMCNSSCSNDVIPNQTDLDHNHTEDLLLRFFFQSKLNKTLQKNDVGNDLNR